MTPQEQLEFYYKILGKEFEESFKNHAGRWKNQNSDWAIVESLSLFNHIDSLPIRYTLVERIINNIISNIADSWIVNDLTIAEQATILRELTAQKFDVSNKVTKFPSTTEEARSVFVPTKPSNKFSFINLPRKVISIIIVIAMLFYMAQASIGIIVGSLLFSHLVWCIIDFASHEAYTHNYAIPRNKVIGRLIFMFSALYGALNFDEYKRNHIIHHKCWKTKYDNVQNALDYSKLGYFLLYSPSPMLKLDYTNQNTVFPHKMVIRYTILVYLAVTLTFGISTLFFFLILPRLLFPAQVSLFVELLPHGFAKTVQDEHDYPWLVPLAGTMAFHTSHHLNPKYLEFGNNYVKYINPHYYIFKLLYIPKESNEQFI